MLDAPVSSPFDAAVASLHDARGEPGGMVVAHLVYTPEGRHYHAFGQNTNRANFFADNVTYQTKHNAFVLRRPYQFRPIAYWYGPGPLDTPILWPPSLAWEDLLPILGHVPRVPIPRADRIITIGTIERLLRSHAPGVTHVFHAIDYGITENGERVESVVNEWLAIDAKRTVPLSSPDRVTRHTDAGRWVRWRETMMADLPQLHDEWVEAQP